MEMVVAFFCVVIFVKLVAASAIVPCRSSSSTFELERRAKAGDNEARLWQQREAHAADVVSLQRVLSALLLVAFVTLSVVAFGWLWGVLLSLFVALEYSAIARIGFIRRSAQSFYDIHEARVFRMIEKFPWLMKLIRAAVPTEPRGTRVESREELIHFITTVSAYLTADEKKLLLSGLKFEDKTVKDIMTPRSVIDSIDQKELLGPLVLDDLHKTGHSRFPVTDGDIDHIIGVLYVRDLLELTNKKSVTAGKAMEPKVYYIREDHSLSHALAAFLRTHHHLFVVINQYRETVGLLSLEDVIEALLGRKIIDEFDAHHDLRKVAEHNPNGNNHPKTREDV